MVTSLIRAALLLGLSAGSCHASDVAIKGLVRDISGAGVPNASVYLRGTESFAISGIDGRFELSAPANSDAALIAVHAGFRAFETRVALQSESIAIEIV